MHWRFSGTKGRRSLGLAVALLWAAWWPASAQQGAQGGEWRVWGGDLGSTRYSPLEQINRQNVQRLKLAWSWRFDNFSHPPEYRSETTPLMVKGVLYFTAGFRRTVVAIDAGTGETLWMWRPDEGERFDRAPRRVSRGVSYWTDGREARIFTVTPGFHLVALDARTGRPVRGFGRKGAVDLFEALGVEFDPTGTIGNSSPPAVVGDVVIVGPAFVEMSRPRSMRQTKGDVMAFDARTGRKLWTFHTIPRPGEFGYETWRHGAAEYTGNAGVWAPISADEKLGYVYLPVEAATGDYYGGHRPGANLFSSSLVCLDARTGRRIWHQQLVHHDIWDYDVASAPILVDLRVAGKPVRAVVQVPKQAFAFVFDRVTGEPIWPLEERSVPRSDVPGEWTSATQPTPSKPPAFDRQGIRVDDLLDWTPELRRLALDAIAPYRIGSLFTPPSLVKASDGTQGTLGLPGNLGGANWEGGAADPETGYVYVSSITRPTLFALVTPQPGESDMRYVGLALHPPVPTVEGLPVVKPPYGRITAYDMNRGEIAWQVANGETPPTIAHHPRLRELTIPPTGHRSRSGLLVTKTLLFAADGTPFAGESLGETPFLRAYDKRTGELVWRTEIPVGPMTGPPMTYLHEGKQFIVFAAGSVVTRTPAQLLAYTVAE